MVKQKPLNPELVRLHMLLTSEEAQELDDWQFEHRHRTRTAAIKALMRLGYEASKAPTKSGSKKGGG